MSDCPQYMHELFHIIPPRKKKTTSAFLHQLEKRLNLTITRPPSILLLCSVFCADEDQFDSTDIDENIVSFDNNNQTITYIPNFPQYFPNFHQCLMNSKALDISSSTEIDSVIHKGRQIRWIFCIDHAEDLRFPDAPFPDALSSIACGIKIGIKDNYKKSFLTLGCDGLATSDYDDIGYGAATNLSFKKGDFIWMVLDLKRYNIYIRVNHGKPTACLSPSMRANLRSNYRKFRCNISIDTMYPAQVSLFDFAIN